MIYRILADFVLVSHLAFIVFVVVGGLLTLRWRWTPFVHLPAACWGAFTVATGGLCPLTPLAVAANVLVYSLVWLKGIGS